MAYEFLTISGQARDRLLELFTFCSEEELNRLSQSTISITYRRGERLCKQGGHLSHLIYIDDGLIKVFIEEEDKNPILFLKQENELIGMDSIFRNDNLYYSAAAVTDVRATLIDKEVFRQVISTNSDLAYFFLERSNLEYLKLYDRLSTLANKQLHGRLAELILYFKNNVYEANPFRLNLSKTELSELLFASKESISRILTELKRDGIIREGDGEFHILDEDKLTRISQTV